MSPITTTTTHALEHKTSSGHPDIVDYAQRSTEDPSRWNRGPTRKRYRPKPKPKDTHWQGAHKPHPPWPKKRSAEQRNTLLNRLSPQSPGTLLDRIGVQLNSDNEADLYETTTATDSVPHVYTPEPGEVERFLESVISAPFDSETPTNDACLVKQSRPILAVDTQNLDNFEVPVKLENQSSSPVYSPTVTPLNGPSFDQARQGNISSPMAVTSSSTTLEQCRDHLVPVVLAAINQKHTGTSTDFEQCAALLTDDKCQEFLRQAKEMRHQMANLPQKSPEVNASSEEGPKRDRVDEDDSSSRSKRGRFGSVGDDVSRRDSDATLVGSPITASAPKAPREKLELIPHAQVSPNAGQTPPGVAQITEGVSQFQSTSDHEMVIDGTSSIPGPLRAGKEAQLPSESSALSTARPASHPLIAPGMWFKQIGNGHPEVLDIDIHVSSDLFLSSSSSINMDVRLCCFRRNIATQQDFDLDTSPEALEAAIQSDACQWPKKGSLVVQVNRDFPHGRTLLPHALDSRYLNVSSSITPGRNTFRFIQLSDLSDFTFALLAFVPSPEDAWKSWDWATTLKPSLSGDQPGGILTAFARIPFVTVQS